MKSKRAVYAYCLECGRIFDEWICPYWHWTKAEVLHKNGIGHKTKRVFQRINHDAHADKAVDSYSVSQTSIRKFRNWAKNWHDFHISSPTKPTTTHDHRTTKHW